LVHGPIGFDFLTSVPVTFDFLIPIPNGFAFLIPTAAKFALLDPASSRFALSLRIDCHRFQKSINDCLDTIPLDT
jgi:hypothetical protein